MRLSNLADYAVVMLAAAARKPDGRLNASLLAEETGVPLPTAQKLVGRLATAGLIASSRGHSGGFRLARHPSEISLADIVEAVEGPIAMTACVEQGKHDCSVEHSCRVRPHWNAVNDAMRGALAGVSLESLARLPGESRGPVLAEGLAPGVHRGTEASV